MKLLFALLVVSALTLKVEGAAKDYNVACTEGTDTCTPDNTDCKDDGTGSDTKKCLCSVNYVYDGSSACKLVGGQACTENTKTNCVSGGCTDDKCDGKEENDASCTINANCKSFNCKWKDGTEKCAAAVAGTVLVSLTLMLVTLVTTRFL